MRVISRSREADSLGEIQFRQAAVRLENHYPSRYFFVPFHRIVSLTDLPPVPRLPVDDKTQFHHFTGSRNETLRDARSSTRSHPRGKSGMTLGVRKPGYVNTFPSLFRLEEACQTLLHSTLHKIRQRIAANIYLHEIVSKFAFVFAYILLA